MPKYRKMLSDWDVPYIQSLLRLIETQSKTTLINWSVGYADIVILPLWNKYYPKDLRPKRALLAANDWSSRTIRLPEAKDIILECHKAAREVEDNPVAQAAARAIGQCASTIHTPTHCIGLALYGALAVAYDALGFDAPFAELEQYAAIECGRMYDALKIISIPDEPNPAKLNWNC